MRHDKKVYVIVQTVGYNAPGTEEGWDHVAGRDDLGQWVEAQGVHVDNPDLFVLVTGEDDGWEAEGGPEFRAVAVDLFTWAAVRRLEAERHAEYGRHADAAMILREVRDEVDAALRPPLREAVGEVLDAAGGNYSEAGRRIGMSGVAVKKWVE